MNIYENIVIFDSSLSDEEAEGAVTKIKGIVTGSSGEVLKVDIWGRRKLAYEIKKQKKGIYVLLLYKTPPEAIKKLEDFFRVFDAVIKYMIIKLDSKQIRDLEKFEAVSEPAEQKTEA
jgi:small subunit ribosomal protein S6